MPSETAVQIETPLHMEALWGGGTKTFACKVWVTWPNWLPYLYTVKTFENILPRNWMADDLETWYAAFATKALSVLFKWWPLIDLNLFYGKVKFGHLNSVT